MLESDSKLKDAQQELKDHIIDDEDKIELPFDKKRLAIYRQSYYEYLCECLQGDFEISARYVGVEAFQQLCYRYVKLYPPDSHATHRLGARLSQFIEQSSSDDERLRELMVTEYEINQLLLGPDESIVGLDQIKRIAPEQWPYLKFEFISNIMSRSLSYTTPELFDNANEDLGVLPYPRPRLWWFWRRHYTIHFSVFSQFQSALLRQLMAGHTLAQVCERWALYLPEQEVIPFIQQALDLWIGQGLVRSYAIAA